jgi:hypothetical protein
MDEERERERKEYLSIVQFVVIAILFAHRCTIKRAKNFPREKKSSLVIDFELCDEIGKRELICHLNLLISMIFHSVCDNLISGFAEFYTVRSLWSEVLDSIGM